MKRRSLEQKGDGVSFANARPGQKKKPKPSKRSSVDRGISPSQTCRSVLSNLGVGNACVSQKPLGPGKRRRPRPSAIPPAPWNWTRLTRASHYSQNPSQSYLHSAWQVATLDPRLSSPALHALSLDSIPSSWIPAWPSQAPTVVRR